MLINEILYFKNFIQDITNIKIIKSKILNVDIYFIITKK